MSLSSLSLYPSLSEPLGMTIGLLLGRLECGVNMLAGLCCATWVAIMSWMFNEKMMDVM